MALCASAHAGIILKGPSGIITPNGPIGPDGRGAGAGWVGAGAWSGDDGRWDGDDGSWKGDGAWGGNDIILKGPSGAITKNGPIGPDAIQAGWGGEGKSLHKLTFGVLPELLLQVPGEAMTVNGEETMVSPLLKNPQGLNNVGTF